MSKHTPTPWKTPLKRTKESVYVENRDCLIAHVFDQDDAKLIVRAVNSHEALVEALERITKIENKLYGGDWDEIEEARGIARAAIAKATGEKA